MMYEVFVNFVVFEVVGIIVNILDLAGGCFECDVVGELIGCLIEVSVLWMLMEVVLEVFNVVIGYLFYEILNDYVCVGYIIIGVVVLVGCVYDLFDLFVWIS